MNNENMTFKFWDKYMHLEQEDLKLFNFVLQFDFGDGNSEYSYEELKGKLENASEEETRKILEATKKNVEDAGVILDDAELDQAAGGDAMGMDPFMKRPFM